ncbi:MAG: hypothetical protein AMXMBFR53_18380 [Gemmatimonadota bacterium]
MSHLDEGQLLTLRDGAGIPVAEAAAHLAACARCREALEASRQRSAAVAGALGVLDGGFPHLAHDLERARERVRLRVSEHAARAAGATSLPARRTRRAAWSASKAAGLLLVTAAGLSALPGSPVRRWIGERLEPAAEVAAPSAAPAAAEAVAPPAPEEAGVRLPLTAGPLAVVLRDAAPGTEIRVRWITGSEAAVFAPVGSRFTSGQGRIEAAGVAGVVRVELPRGVTPVSLEVNGRILLRSTPEGVDVPGDAVDRTADGLTFRLPPG